MTILVDADGVLENLPVEFPALLNEKYGTDVQFEQMREWGFAKSFPKLTYEQIFSAELEETLYDRIRPIGGAPEYLKKLIDDGNTVYVVTSTPYEAVSLKMKKVMERFFPFLTWKNFIIASRKQMIKGDVLIEELAGNVIEHGFTDGKNHQVDLRVVTADDEVIFKITDNCRRFDFNKKVKLLRENANDPEKNLGLKLALGFTRNITYLNVSNKNILILTI